MANKDVSIGDQTRTAQNGAGRSEESRTVHSWKSEEDSHLLAYLGASMAVHVRGSIYITPSCSF